MGNLKKMKNTMEIDKINDDSGKGFTTVFRDNDVELTDPIEHYMNHSINVSVTMEKNLIAQQDPSLIGTVDDSFFIKRGIKAWEQRYKEIEKTIVPPNFILLLESKSKKEQIKLLRGENLTSGQLIAYIFRAFKEYGFLFSQYRSEHYHKGLDKDDLPKLVEVNGDEVRTVGETSLTDGQLKQAVNYRKVIIAKFLDKGDEWHCFFVTYNSIGGKETWKGGQPHFHYISDKWGISREEAVKKFKSNRYPTTNVHIGLLGYGKQPQKKE